MSYTINPNAKNRWARNAENTMDLSLETDASSVYLDNGRTLEQELGEGSMVSNVATVDSSMSKVIDGTLDGAYESGVMYGRSLVNVLDKKKLLIGQNTTLEDDGSITAIANGGYYNLYFSDNGTIKENSEYLLIYEVVENTLDVDFYVNGGLLVSGLYENLIADGVVIPPSTTGYFVKKVQTRSKAECINDFKVLRTFIDTGATVGRKIKYRVQLIEYQESMEEWDIPYFEDLCDVKMPILRNVGKNLFNTEDVFTRHSQVTNLFITQNSIEYTSKAQYASVANEAIRLKKGKKYSFSADIKGCRLFFREVVNGETQYYVLNKDYTTSYEHATITFTPQTDTCVFEMNSASTEQKNIGAKNIQLEESSSTTTYEDHKTNILHTPEIVTLRSLPNDVRDELNLKTGEYIKRIGEIVLDGSEGWNYQPRDNEVNTLMFQCEVYDMAILQSEDNHSDKVLACDKHKVLSSHQLWGTDTQAISKGQSTKQIRIRVLKSNLATLDVAGFKLWLSQNPITVQYELATPITTTIEPLSVPFAYENGHIVLESGYEGQSLLPTLEYSTVINRTGQIQSIANTVQKQEKQITKLEQMLIQNIVDLDYNNTLLTLKNEMEEML